MTTARLWKHCGLGRKRCPARPVGAERDQLAEEMAATAQRIGSPRAEMWGRLWRVEVLSEGGEFAAADRLLPDLGRVVRRVGGPISGWLHDRAAAGIA